jgi:hypothetical protein
VQKEIGPEFVVLSRAQLQGGHTKIKHCLEQLADEELWWRPADGLNSVGNILLHLSGNLRQWIISGVSGAKDVRDRPAEFSATDVARAEVLAALDTAVSETDSVLEKLLVQIDEFGTEILLTDRRIQGFDETIMSAIYDSIAHFRGHVQEIIHITRALRKDDYKFHWTPTSPEQGA